MLLEDAGARADVGGNERERLAAGLADAQRLGCRERRRQRGDHTAENSCKRSPPVVPASAGTQGTKPPARRIGSPLTRGRTEIRWLQHRRLPLGRHHGFSVLRPPWPRGAILSRLAGVVSPPRRASNRP